MVASAEDDIVAIAFEAVVKILGDRTVARQMVHAIVKKSLASDQQVGALIVRVSPADYKLLVGELESLQRQGVEGEFRVVEDARVQLGGCLLETDRGVLDARLETQMERLRKALLDAKASET